jgi:hypothetical protein
MLPFSLSDFIRLLQLGFTGLAGALLLLSFFLLLSEQRRPQVRAKMLQAIQRWVIICIVVLTMAILPDVRHLTRIAPGASICHALSEIHRCPELFYD